MAYGNLVAYEPAPETPGAYRFQHKDGRKLLAFGPEAEALKRKLDESAAMAPQKVAEAKPGSPHPLAAALSAASPALGTVTSWALPNQTATDVPTPSPAAAPAQPFNAKAAASELTGAPAPKPATAPAPNTGIGAQPGVPVDPTNLGLGYRMNPQTGMIERFEAPRAGSRGGMVERSRTIQGGHEVDQEFLGEQEYIQGSAKAAEALGQEAADDVATAEAAYNQRLLEHQTNQAAEAQARADAITARVKELDDRYTKLEKDFTSSRVDPGRMFAGGKNWAYGLAAGLATFGAGLSKTPNVAVQVLQQRIADDIRAQEAEVAVKRDAADNAYKRLLQETGSSELAKKALEGIQLAKLRSEFEVMAKDGKDKARQAQGVAMLAELDKRYSLWKQGYLQSAAGVTTKQLVNVPGSAGSAGGWRPVGDQLGTARGIQEVRKGEAQVAAAGGPGKLPTSVVEKVAGLDAGIQALDRLDLLHAQAGRGGVMQERFGDSAQFAANVDALVPVVDAAKQGGAPNESTMAALKEALKSGNGDKIKEAIAAERRILEDRKRALESARGTVQPDDRVP